MIQSQFALLGTRRFLPFFITQALGAFNDNVFKQSLILAILYKLNIEGDRTVWVNLCALLFILPFFLFSALAGQLGEKFAKEKLMRLLKLAEVLIMLVGAAGFVFNHLGLMLLALFAMGVHSALFGPVKYSILPQALQQDELIGGNGLVEMGTFLAILAGTITAGILLSTQHYAAVVGTAVVLIAVLGYLASRAIPPVAPSAPRLKLEFNIATQTWATLRLGFRQAPAVSAALLGNSWFWFTGAVYLTQIPAFAKEWLDGDETVVTLILTVFSVGIALGSMLCERLSGRRVEIGLVPLGALGLSVFGLLLWWSAGDLPQVTHARDWLEVLAVGQAGWVLANVLGLGVFGGFYIVPLYTLMQSRSDEHERARVIAANNILNALFMVMSAIVSILLLSVLKWSIPQLFLLVALTNIAVNAWLFRTVPEFPRRFVGWLRGGIAH